MLTQQILEKMRPKVSDLAEKLGVDRRTLAFWQKGERTPSAENLRSLADLADDQSDDLLTLARRLRREASEKERES